MNDKQDGMGALPTARATHELNPQAVSAVPVGIANARVLVFADDPEKAPRLYACAKCGSTHSPAIYLAKPEVAHETARDAAENCYTCRTHDECKYCGCETPKGWLACADCRHSKALEKATEVPDDGGPYCEFEGDRFFTELDEASEAGVEWVSPCTIEYPRLSGYDILDSVLSDMHEDACIDDLRGVSEFMAAVATFNAAQTQQTWFGDNTRKIRVPAQGIEAQRGETVQPARSGTDESPVPSGDADNGGGA